MYELQIKVNLSTLILSD